MKTVTVGPNDAGQRVDKFLSKAVPRLPKTLLYKYLRLKRIKINGKRAAVSQRLEEGQEIELYINDEFFIPKEDALAFLAAPPQVDIVYEDKNLLIADKKPGLVVHEDESGSPDTLLDRIRHLLCDRGEYDPKTENAFAPALCNRIDRNTGGLVLAAKNAAALRAMDACIKEREVQKRYLCIVHGCPDEKSGTLKTFQVRDKTEKRVRVYDHPVPDGLTAITKYRVLDRTGPLSLLEIELVTGRTHQIRATFAHIGHPLLGDGKYGENAQDRPYGIAHQALYAYRTTFAFPPETETLGYLSGRTFSVPDVWFAARTPEGWRIRQEALRPVHEQGPL